MINQIYVNSTDSYIICTIRASFHISEIKGAVLLIPGFSQSMCDIDYFMTKLANMLNDQGYATMQIDICGHGDSYGDLAVLNCETVKKNIASAYEYLKEWCNRKPIIGVARGLYANILCVNNLSSMFNYIIGINPVIAKLCIDDSKCKKNKICNFSDLIANDEMYDYLFTLLGAEKTNIIGQRINTSFIYEALYYINNALFPNNAVILSSYNDDMQMEKLTSPNLKQNVKYMSERCFVRDHEWQENLANIIVNSIKEMDYEDTFSNK